MTCETTDQVNGLDRNLKLLLNKSPSYQPNPSRALAQLAARFTVPRT